MKKNTIKLAITFIFALLILLPINIFAAYLPLSPEFDTFVGPIIFHLPADDYSSHPIIIREITGNKIRIPSHATDGHFVAINGTYCTVLSNASIGYDKFNITCQNGYDFGATVTKSLTVKTLDRNNNRNVLLKGNSFNTALVWIYKHLNTEHKKASMKQNNNTKDKKQKTEAND